MRLITLAIALSFVTLVIAGDVARSQTVNGGSSYSDVLYLAIPQYSMSISVATGSQNPVILTSDSGYTQATGPAPDQHLYLTIVSGVKWNLVGNAPAMAYNGHSLSTLLTAKQSGTGTYEPLNGASTLYSTTQLPTSSTSFTVDYKQSLAGPKYAGTYTTTVTWTVTPVYP